MNKDQMLYPNCSEIVWRLGGIVHSTDTSTYFGDCCLDQMIESFENAKKQKKDLATLKLYKLRDSGGGNWNFIKAVLPVARDFATKKITKRVAHNKEYKLWTTVKE